MPKTIPQLTDATSVNAADEFVIQQSGITKRVTRNELMTFAATGSTTSRLVNDRFADIINVKDFGAVGDGATDDRAAIQAALDAAAASGGGVVELDAKTYAISATLNIPSLVSLVGRGGSQYAPSASFASAEFTAQPKTRIVATTGWASGTPVISVKTAAAASYTTQGVTLSGFMIDCAGFAERGLDVVSVKHCRFVDLLIYRATVLGVLETVLSGADVTTQGNNATQFNTWDSVTVWVASSGSVPATAVGWQQTGTAAHNINQCVYNNIQIVHTNGIGLDIVNADSNIYTRLSTYSFGVGIGCVMRGADLTETTKYARNNTFIGSIFGGANAAAHSGTAQSGSTNSIVLASAANSTNSYYSDKTITLTGGTGAGQVRRIGAYTGSTRTATVTRPWRTTPDNTTTYSIQKGGGAEITAGQGTRSGTAQAGAASSITLAASDPASSSDYTNLLILITGGTGSGQVRRISAYAGTSTRVATVSEAWATAPDSTSTYTVYGVGLSSSGNTLINNQSEGNGAGSINIESRAAATHLDERFAHFCDATEPSIRLENPRVFGAGTLGTLIGLGRLSEGVEQELARLKFFRQGAPGTESCRIDFETYQTGSISSRAYIANGLVLNNAAGGDKGAGTVNITGGLFMDNNAVADSSRHIGLRSYTVATLPVATTAARLIYVSDGTSNKRMAVSDGTNWRFPDGNIVS